MRFPRKQRRMLRISLTYFTIFLSLMVVSLLFPSYYQYLIGLVGIAALWLLIDEKMKGAKARNSM